MTHPLLTPSRAVGALFGAVLMVLPLQTQAQGIVPDQVVQAEILPGWRIEGGRHMVALHLRLAEGWKTYWRIPGEAGIAPSVDWSASQNLESVTPIWPRPHVFMQNGMTSIGYSGELILPLEITPSDPSRPVALIASVSIGVCRDVCVPVDLQITQAVRGDGGPDARINAALATRAQPAGLRTTTCRLEPTARGAELTLRATLPSTGADEHIVMELPGSGYFISDSQTWREGGDLVARARVRDPQRGPISIDRSALAFTVISEGRMLTAQGCRGG